MGIDFDYFSKFLLCDGVLGSFSTGDCCFPSRRPGNVAEYGSLLCKMICHKTGRVMVCIRTSTIHNDQRICLNSQSLFFCRKRNPPNA